MGAESQTDALTPITFLLPRSLYRRIDDYMRTLPGTTLPSGRPHRVTRSEWLRRIVSEALDHEDRVDD